MDWYAWLSAARLDQAVAYEYALVFSRNELEADDLAYFDHEFLHSMGVSVAKHRLEILKLARRSRRRAALSSRLVAAVDLGARARAEPAAAARRRQDAEEEQVQAQVDQGGRRRRRRSHHTESHAVAGAGHRRQGRLDGARREGRRERR
jgi:hypothetical protein